MHCRNPDRYGPRLVSGLPSRKHIRAAMPHIGRHWLDFHSERYCSKTARSSSTKRSKGEERTCLVLAHLVRSAHQLGLTDSVEQGCPSSARDCLFMALRRLVTVCGAPSRYTSGCSLGSTRPRQRSQSACPLIFIILRLDQELLPGPADLRLKLIGAHSLSMHAKHQQNPLQIGKPGIGDSAQPRQ